MAIMHLCQLQANHWFFIENTEEAEEYKQPQFPYHIQCKFSQVYLKDLYIDLLGPLACNISPFKTGL